VLRWSCHVASLPGLQAACVLQVQPSRLLCGLDAHGLSMITGKAGEHLLCVLPLPLCVPTQASLRETCRPLIHSQFAGIVPVQLVTQLHDTAAAVNPPRLCCWCLMGVTRTSDSLPSPLRLASTAATLTHTALLRRALLLLLLAGIVWLYTSTSAKVADKCRCNAAEKASPAKYCGCSEVASVLPTR